MDYLTIDHAALDTMGLPDRVAALDKAAKSMRKRVAANRSAYGARVVKATGGRNAAADALGISVAALDAAMRVRPGAADDDGVVTVEWKKLERDHPVPRDYWSRLDALPDALSGAVRAERDRCVADAVAAAVSPDAVARAIGVKVGQLTRMVNAHRDRVG